jgi:hypothetical protein
MIRRSVGLGLLASGLVSLVGCSLSEEPIAPETSSNDLIGHVAGSGISSPNANKNATYLSARRIDSLTTVGAMTKAQSGLAERVDGIIANQPADGRFSVAELLQIEKPGFIETLFPEERAELPALWALLETSNAAPANVSPSPPMTVAGKDVSTPAGAPIEPASLKIDSLPANLQQSSTRLELTHDSDGDASTVTKDDLNAAIAAPGPYTPADVAAFESVLDLFVARATSTLSAVVEVPAPFTTSTTLASFGAASLSLSETLDYRETRGCTAFSGGGGSCGLSVAVSGHHTWSANLAVGANQQAIVLDETSDQERVVAGGTIDFPTAGPVTVEIWSGGSRLGSWRANVPVLGKVDENVDLSKFADYTFIANGAPLVRSVDSAKTDSRSWYNVHFGNESSTSYSASFTYDQAARPASGAVDASALATLATPALPITPGRYEVSAGAAGLIDVDLYPGGVVRVTRVGTGASMRASLYRWAPMTKWDADFSDRFRVILAPDGELEIFFDGQRPLFDANISTATRKG